VSATTSSERVAERFAQLRATGRRALVPYVTAGHPSPDATVDLLQGLERAGADILEIGVPFSDPMADGPIIQASSQKALAAGMTFDGVLDAVSRSRLHIPTVLFTYLNPLLAAGRDALARAADAGFHAVLVTDLPVGADASLEQWLGDGPLAFIRLVAPTTPAARMVEIAQHGSGFVYLISRLGVTGVRDQLPADLPETIGRLRQSTELPICVGFGVSRPEQAQAVARLADGVIVGSAMVRAADESLDSAFTLAASLRAAIDTVSP
jgi:tryptophan synthase alpha chain